MGEWLDQSWLKTYDPDWKVYSVYRLMWIGIMFSPIFALIGALLVLAWADGAL
jgi:hypothetical protein